MSQFDFSYSNDRDSSSDRDKRKSKRSGMHIPLPSIDFGLLDPLKIGKLDGFHLEKGVDNAVNALKAGVKKGVLKTEQLFKTASKGAKPKNSRPVRTRTIYRSAEIEHNHDDFLDPSFDRDDYIEELFTKRNWRNDETFIKELKEEKQGYTVELQNLVVDNYEHFIEISKQLMHFVDVDMIELGTCINELKKSIKTMQRLDLRAHTQDPFAASRSLQNRHSVELPEHMQRFEDLLLEMDAAIEIYNYDRIISLNKEICELLNSEQIEEEVYTTGGKLVELHQALQERLRAAIDQILQVLSSPHTTQQKRCKFVTYLKQLDSTDSARNEFLRSCSLIVQRKLRAVSFKGDMIVFIDRSSMALFQRISSVMVSFRQLFSENTDMSAFSQWVLSELSRFCALFKLHVFNNQLPLETVARCASRLLMYCQQMEQRGVTVAFHVERLLDPELEQAIVQHMNYVEHQLFNSLAEESWTPVSSSDTTLIKSLLKLDSNTDKIYPVKTFVLLIQLIYDFISSASLVPSIFLYTTVVSKIISLVEKHLANVYKIAIQEFLSDSQFMLNIANTLLVKNFLVQSLKDDLANVFNRRVPEMERLAQHVERLDELLVQRFAQIRAHSIIDEKIGWGMALRYPAINPRQQDQDRDQQKSVTSTYFSVFTFTAKLIETIQWYLPEEYIKDIVQRMFNEMASLVSSEQGDVWMRIHLTVKEVRKDQQQQQQNTKSHVSDEYSDGATEEDLEGESYIETETTDNGNLSPTNRSRKGSSRRNSRVGGKATPEPSMLPDTDAHKLTSDHFDRILIDISFFKECTEIAGLMDEYVEKDCHEALDRIRSLVDENELHMEFGTNDLISESEIDKIVREAIRSREGFEDVLHKIDDMMCT